MSGTLQGVGLEILDRCNAGKVGGGGGRGPIAKKRKTVKTDNAEVVQMAPRARMQLDTLG